MGLWDVDGMLEAMSSRQMAEWMVYHKLEPFGSELIDIHLATIAASLANQNRKKGQAAKKPKDFRLWKVDERAEADELYARLRSWAVMAGKSE